MQYIIELIQQRQELVSDLPQWVKIWVLFIRIIFFSSLVFLFWWTPARWVFAVMILTGVLNLTLLNFAPGLDTKQVGTVVQLVLWIPLALYMFRQLKTNSFPGLGSDRIFTKIYSGWAILVAGVLFVAIAMNFFQALTWLF
ncbi:MAG: hypothetical protein L3J21_03865 [Devosiaceae bacterium]|nr:hypothetical protein [Devosiaceae bacterium]